jgi:serine/threonine-protein kinase
MSKKSPPSRMTQKTTPVSNAGVWTPRPAVLAALTAIAFVSALLALFQWMELLVLYSGGKSVCAISKALDCELVWKTPFAKWVHANLGVPVAGMGLVWALAAFALAVRVFVQRANGADCTNAIVAVRVTGAVGAFASVGLALVSLRAGAFCPTCLATYALSFVYALLALFALPRPIVPSGGSLWRGAAASLVTAALAYGVALAPGRATPAAGASLLPISPAPSPKVAAKPGAATLDGGTSAAGASADKAVEEALAYIERLAPGPQLELARSLATYRTSKVIDMSSWPTRRRLGPEDAPARIVEFTDVLCGHCADLVETMEWIKHRVPDRDFSIEARHFPLDAACNSELLSKEPGGLRCLGAQVLVCLEKVSDFWALRRRIFGAQEHLTREKLFTIATSSGTMKRADLEACVASAETAEALKADVAFAAKLQPDGTPIVLVNGRTGTALPAFLYTMIRARGDPESPIFAKVPRVAPPRREPHD